VAYNADKKYDIILSKAGDNILLANKRFDITQDVINGLNKRYRPGTKKAAVKEDKKEDKKDK
jgi:outer membrane protein